MNNLKIKLKFKCHFKTKNPREVIFNERPMTCNSFPLKKKSHMLVSHFTFMVKHKASPKQQQQKTKTQAQQLH